MTKPNTSGHDKLEEQKKEYPKSTNEYNRGWNDAIKENKKAFSSGQDSMRTEIEGLVKDQELPAQQEFDLLEAIKLLNKA